MNQGTPALGRRRPPVGITGFGTSASLIPGSLNPSSLDLDPSKALPHKERKKKSFWWFRQALSFRPGSPNPAPACVCALGLQPGEVGGKGEGDSKSRVGGPCGSWGWGGLRDSFPRRVQGVTSL